MSSITSEASGSPMTTKYPSSSSATNTHSGPNASRRRDKPQLSCNLCRRRKSKCDRQQPCARCASRGLPCTYADNQTATLSPASAGDCLAQLESLVMTLMRNSAQNNVNDRAEPVMDLTDPTSTMEEHSECGSMSVTPSELRYVGSDHWAAILDKIADLKDHFDQEEVRVVESPYQIQDDSVDGSNSDLAFRSPHALLLYGSGCTRAASRAEILNALPPRSTVDRYISRYFNQLELVASSAVHGPSFLREYEAFWTNPSEAPVMWIGLLFSMICLAVLASSPSDFMHGHEAEQQSLQIDLYREKIVQSLTMGEYTKSGPFVLETLINYIYVEFGIRTDANKDVWFLLALEVNLAMRMGYHRDPRHFPRISPLQGEMRRRMWTTVLLSDILISSQMGMPRIIKEWQCDTEEPRNLNDTDLDENTAELPPPRPETEHTTTLGVIARRRMLIALGTISDITDAVKTCNYTEIMRVDKMLQEAASSIPPPLKMNTIAASVTDSPQVTMARFFIRHLFYKGQIRLHRRFLYTSSPSSPSAAEDPYEYSRKACLDASLGTFQIQHVLEEETCPGGQLHSLRWRVTSSMNHLFLTATMILCSLLHRKQTMGREEEIIAALWRTREVWVRRSQGSKEARKAAETVSFVLEKARGGGGGGSVGASGSDTYQASVELGGVGSIGLTPENQGLQGEMGPYGSDRFMMPDLMENFAISNTEPQLGFGFDMGMGMKTIEDDMGLDEWIPMSGGTSW